MDENSNPIPVAISNFVDTLEDQLQSTPLDKLPLLFSAWNILLSNVSMQVHWEAYDQYLIQQKEELGILDLLLAEILQCSKDEGLSTGLSLKQLEKDRPKRLKSEMKEYDGSSVADTIVYLFKDIGVWLRQSIATVVSLPRGRVIGGILSVTHDCVNEVLVEMNSDIRKRCKFPFQLFGIIIICRFISQLQEENCVPLEKTLKEDIRVIYEIIDAIEGAKISVSECYNTYSSRIHTEKRIKKPKSNANKNTDPDADIKCRFVLALHTIERHGILRIGGTGRNSGTIHCQMFKWLRDDG